MKRSRIGVRLIMGQEYGQCRFPGIVPSAQAKPSPYFRASPKLRQLAADLRRRNLDNAVRLAQQAAAGHEHFAELGRRCADELLSPRAHHPRSHPGLRIVEGGRPVHLPAGPPPAA